jgi:multiple sugar transport system ATP-binding protein
LKEARVAEAALNNVTKRFGDTVAIADLSLRVANGEFIVLLGPTGAGKTTTLRLFAGLERPEAGSVEIAGRDVTALDPSQRDVAFVFQQYSLYPHYSVFDNLAFPLRAPGMKMDAGAIRKRVTEVAEMLRIGSKLENRATQLSGGEMQRVAIGRALVREPNLFLMDEPLSSLDAKLREDLRVELKRIQRELGATIVYVTHDQLEAMTLADRIGVLSSGSLLQIATPRDVYERPANIYAAQRLGSPQINLLQKGLLDIYSVPAGAETIGVRPEDVVLNGGGRVARALTVEHLGVESVALLDVAGTHVHALLGARTHLSEGDEVNISVRPEASLFFDAAGDLIDSPAPAPIRVNGNAPPESRAAKSTGGANMSETLIRDLISKCADVIAAHKDELTELDQPIGDGDHGLNMARGFGAVAASTDEIAALPCGEALKKAGTTLVMKVGGASGPLYGSLLLGMGKAVTDLPQDKDGIAAMVGVGVEAVKSRGKSDAGAKTMLDVLVPVHQALAQGGGIAEIRATADAGLAATRDMLATKGRAAFLGERSIGHLDPGARSSALLVHAICDVLEEK